MSNLVHFSLQYEVCGPDSSFFVDDWEAAGKLADIDEKITTIQGCKLRYSCRCVKVNILCQMMNAFVCVKASLSV
jgi:hypothetical protein